MKAPYSIPLEFQQLETEVLSETSFDWEIYDKEKVFRDITHSEEEDYWNYLRFTMIDDKLEWIVDQFAPEYMCSIGNDAPFCGEPLMPKTGPIIHLVSTDKYIEYLKMFRAPRVQEVITDGAISILSIGQFDMFDDTSFLLVKGENAKLFSRLANSECLTNMIRSGEVTVEEVQSYLSNRFGFMY